MAFANLIYRAAVHTPTGVVPRRRPRGYPRICWTHDYVRRILANQSSFRRRDDQHVCAEIALPQSSMRFVFLSLPRISQAV